MSDDDLRREIAELRRRLDDLVAIPRVQEMVEQHANYLATQEVDARSAEAQRKFREQQVAEFRRRVEIDPLVDVSMAPDAVDAHGRPVKRVCTHAGFDVAVPGDKFKGGIAIDGFGQPTPPRLRMLRSEWTRMVATDHELRVAVKAGHLVVETIPIEQVASALCDGRLEFQRYYHR